MKKILFSLSIAILTISQTHASSESDDNKIDILYSAIGIDRPLASKETINTHLVNIFDRWAKHTTEKLNSESSVILTASGPIEYVKKGSGPVVLCLHGGFGGYDQAILIGENIKKHGFTVLAPSRPGYLRTPLSVGQTPEQQADAMINLINALGIDKVGVVGFSSGCPVAFQMALRYPNKVWGLALECLGAQADQGPIYELLIDLAQIDPLADFSSWLLYLATRSDFRGTAEFILTLDNNMPEAQQYERSHYVLKHSSQTEFLKKLIHSSIPLSSRKNGLNNDISNLNPWLTPSYIGLYSLVKTPTMIIESINDSNGNYQEAIFVSQQMNAELVSVANTGHFIWIGNRTKKWQTLLTRFLKTNSP